jgi:hypothetical protein
VNDLDWANVIEEIETLGRSEVRGVRSLLRQALTHAMRAAAWPQDPARRHWWNEIRTFLTGARGGFSPSMRHLLDLPEIHADALRDVRDLEMDQPPLPLRGNIDLPWTICPPAIS